MDSVVFSQEMGYIVYFLLSTINKKQWKISKFVAASVDDPTLIWELRIERLLQTEILKVFNNFEHWAQKYELQLNTNHCRLHQF